MSLPVPEQDEQARARRMSGVTVNPPMQGTNHPSTAHYENGQYVHDPINQLYAEQVAQGLTQPALVPQAKHISKISGYCEHLVLGGCDKD